MADKDYSKRKQEDEEALRQLELRTLEEMIAKMPPEKRKELKVVVADRTFTPEQILEEAKKDTDYGRQYLKMLTKHRLERLKRR